jgi:hypothetical protein
MELLLIAGVLLLIAVILLPRQLKAEQEHLARMESGTSHLRERKDAVDR